MEYALTLSIGYPGARHEEVVDIDDEELAECVNDNEREEYLNQIWTDWAWGFIDGGINPVD